MRWLDVLLTQDMNLNKLWERSWRTEEPGREGQQIRQRVGCNLADEQQQQILFNRSNNLFLFIEKRSLIFYYIFY